jgi:hypothetical protein
MSCSVIPQMTTGTGGAGGSAGAGGAGGSAGSGGAGGSAGTTGAGGAGGSAGAGGAGGSTPPAVPVPRGAGFALAALLAGLGISRVRARRRS